MIHLSIRAGIPCWVKDGVALPVMMGAQISDELRALLSGEEEEELDGLAALVGRTLLDLNTNFFGVVRTRTDRRTGRVVYWLSDPNTGRAQDLRDGATLVDPNTRAVINVSTSSTGSAADSTVTPGGKLSEADLRRLFGEEDDGTGGSAPSFASTREAAELAFQQEQTLLEQRHANDLAVLEQQLIAASADKKLQIQADIDLENLRHANDLKELKLQFENQLKGQLLGEIGAERRTLIQEKGRARERQVERAGKDAFRFAFNVRGQEAPTTPEDIFKQQQMAFITQPLPAFDVNASSAQLQAALTQFQGAQPPTGGFLGLPSLAHGGVVTGGGVLSSPTAGPVSASPSSVIDMERGSDGAFNMRGTVPAIVGDAGPELALLAPGSEIIPFSKLPGVDLTGVPRAQEGIVAGGITLVTTPDRPEIFYVQQTPSGPVRYLISASALSFFDLSTVQSVPSLAPFGSLAGFALTSQNVAAIVSPPLTPPPAPPVPSPFSPEALKAITDLANLPFLQKLRLEAGLPATGPLGEDAFSRLGVLPPGVNQPATTGSFATRNPLTLLSALTELGVPQAQAQQISDQFGPFVSPFKSASTLGLGLSNLLPQERTGFNSLFGLLGFTPEDVNFQIQEATPTGRFENPFRIGFTGTRL